MSIEDINFGKINEDIKPFSDLDKDIQNKVGDFFFNVESESHEDVFGLFGSEKYILEVESAEDVVLFILNFGRLLIENQGKFTLDDTLSSLEINDTSKENLSKIFSSDSNYFSILQANSQLRKFIDEDFDVYTNISSTNFKGRIFTMGELKVSRKNDANINLKFNREGALKFKKDINEALDRMIKEIDKDIDNNKKNNFKIIN